MIFVVMEVATGEYGEAVPTLIAAVNSIKNGNSVLIGENEVGIQLQGISSVSKNTTNESNKTNINILNSSNVATATGSISQSHDERTYSKKANDEHTVINLTNNDGLTTRNKIPIEICTTSLLHSSDSVVTLPNKKTFPISGFKQFWILMKRAFKTILRDKQLMHMRLASHVIVGAIIGMIYYDIGNDASKVISNAGCIFFTMLFTMFTGMMPTILTCMYNRIIYIYLILTEFHSNFPNKKT